MKIAWNVPAIQGGGQIKVTSYDVQIEGRDGSWLSNDPDVCDGSNSQETACSFDVEVIANKPFKLYGGLINVRVQATNQVGRSEMS